MRFTPPLPYCCLLFLFSLLFSRCEIPLDENNNTPTCRTFSVADVVLDTCYFNYILPDELKTEEGFYKKLDEGFHRNSYKPLEGKDQSRLVTGIELLQQKGQDEENELHTYLLVLYGNDLGNLNRWTAAIKIFQQAKTLYRTFSNETYCNKGLLATIDNMLAEAYRQIGELENASLLSKSSGLLFEELGRFNDAANSYSNIGLNYWTRGQPSLALPILEKSLCIKKQLLQTLEDSIDYFQISNTFAQATQLLGDSLHSVRHKYLGQKYRLTSLQQHKENAAFLQSFAPSDQIDEQKIYNHLNIAFAYSRLGIPNSSDSVLIHTKAVHQLTDSLDTFSRKLLRSVAKRHEAYAFAIDGKLELAEVQIDSCLKYLEIRDRNNQLIGVLHQTFYSDFLIAKAHVIQLVAENRKNDTILLQRSLQAYEEAYEYFSELRKSLANDASLENLIRTRVGVLTRVSKVAHVLFEQTANRKYLDLAFFFSENLKAFTYRQGAFRQITQLEESSGSSKIHTLLQKEFSFLDRIRQLEAEQVASPDNDSITKSLTFEKEAFSTFINQIRESEGFEEKRFYSNRHDNNTLSLDQVEKQLLDEETAFVEYQIGDGQGFTFVQTKDTTAFFNWPADSVFYSVLEGYRHSLMGRQDDTLNLAYELYQIIFKQVDELFSEKVKNIILIPDPRISQIPFESLLQRPFDGAFDQARYLINDYNFSYHYSGTSLQKTRAFAKLMNIPSVGAIAFNAGLSKATSCGGTELDDLRECANWMNETYGTRVINEARKKDFQRLGNQYGVVQLNMHGCQNDKRDYFLEFNEFGRTDPLYLAEAYTYNINTSLLVMGSCRSGTGKVIIGEGVFSMARPFLFNGTQAVMVTLNDVPDKSTAAILKIFYRNLAETDLSIVEALGEAKRRYIKQQNRPPWFWCNLIYIGDPNQLIKLSNK